MDMTGSRPAVSAEQAGVRAQLSVSGAPEAGTPMRVAYRLTDASGAPLGDVVVSHEHPIHLIVVRRDLEEFQHIHPRPTGAAGEYAVETVFRATGTYVLYAEFTRAGDGEIVQRDELIVGAPSGRGALSTAVGPFLAAPDVRVALETPARVRPGSPERFVLRLEDPRSGRPVRDLAPYLGAPAHVVVLDEGAESFAHTHGEPIGAGHSAAAQGPYGPEIEFKHAFPAAGLYKVWAQFQTADGRVITAAFVIRAEGED